MKLIFLVVLLLPLLTALRAADNPAQPGDRNLPINQVYPPEAFYHNGKGGRVLDVTKPPFNAKGDGVTDDTKALCAAMRFLVENYETKCGDGFHRWCAKLNRSWIIYLPDGEYLVSDTVSQGWPDLVFNIKNGWDNMDYFTIASPEDAAARKADVYGAANWFIRLVGQSRSGTVIRLKDGSAGFAAGANRAVVSYYQTFFSNINYGNYFENLTIDTGKGNPGAIGLKWNGSNWGGIRNAAIRSGDGYGATGLMMDVGIAHGYLRDVAVDGFNVGMQMSAGYASMVVLEHATFSNQRELAIRVVKPGSRDCLAARKILFEQAPVVLKAGAGSHVVLLESKAVGGAVNGPALVVEEGGHLFARDVALSGYASAVAKSGQPAVNGSLLRQYVSDAPVTVGKDAPVRSLALPVKDTPVILPETDLEKWASVDAFGAVGDGLTDDTAAIQRAMNSGKPVIWFPKAAYVVNGSVEIPATVREVCFLHSSVYRSGPVAEGALFKVSQPSSEPLLLRQNVNGGGVFLDHDADRTLVLEDVIIPSHHWRGFAKGPDMLFPGRTAPTKDVWQLYRNTRPDGATKEVFANNVMGFAAGGEKARQAVENVRTWVRQLDNEHDIGVQNAFRRSDAWILGMKTEGSSGKVVFQADQGSRLELLGGTVLSMTKKTQQEATPAPVVISRDSEVSMSFVLWGWASADRIPPSIVLSDETKGTAATVPAGQFPNICKGGIVIPLLVNRP